MQVLLTSTVNTWEVFQTARAPEVRNFPVCVYCILGKTFRGGERVRRGQESNIIMISVMGFAILVNSLININIY